MTLIGASPSSRTHLLTRFAHAVPAARAVPGLTALVLAFVSGCRGCSSGDVGLDTPPPVAAPTGSPRSAATQATAEREPERVTLAELLSSPDAYAGRRVRIAGEPRPGEVHAVTALPCPPAEPCCNSCGSGFSLNGKLPLKAQSNFGCSGDNCNCAKTCTPFPPQDAGVWTFVGTVEVRPLGPNLRVESWSQER